MCPLSSERCKFQIVMIKTSKAELFGATKVTRVPSAVLPDGWVSWPPDHRGAGPFVSRLHRHRHRHARRMWGVVRPGPAGLQGWLSGPLLGCTGRDPLCPAYRRQRQIEDNPQRRLHRGAQRSARRRRDVRRLQPCPGPARRLHCTYTTCVHGGARSVVRLPGESQHVILLGKKLRVGKINICLYINII
jgi:hypothetical protein